MVNIVDQLCNTPKCTEFFVFTSNQDIKFFQQDFSSVVQIFFQDLFKKFSNSPLSRPKMVGYPIRDSFWLVFLDKELQFDKAP